MTNRYSNVNSETRESYGREGRRGGRDKGVLSSYMTTVMNESRAKSLDLDSFMLCLAINQDTPLDGTKRMINRFIPSPPIVLFYCR